MMAIPQAISARAALDNWAGILTGDVLPVSDPDHVIATLQDLERLLICTSAAFREDLARRIARERRAYARRLHRCPSCGLPLNLSATSGRWEHCCEDAP